MFTMVEKRAEEKLFSFWKVIQTGREWLQQLLEIPKVPNVNFIPLLFITAMKN